MGQAALVLGVGVWCVAASGSSRVDPTTPHLSPVRFIAAGFIPAAHVLVPHRMFGDLWASATWHQSDRSEPTHRSLVVR